jgi:anti-anti-sigma factor
MRASIAVPRPCSSAHLARRLRGRSLRLANSRSARSVVVVNVQGDVDASNTNELTAYVRAVRGPHDDVVLDLRGVEFLGVEGFLALETIARECGAPTLPAVVPSPAVARLLRLCTWAPAILVSSDVDAALAAVREPTPRGAAVGRRSAVAARGEQTEVTALA